MDVELKHIGTVELGLMQARLVTDHQGRKCIGIPISGTEVLFTVTQALLTRELIDAGIRFLVQFREPEEQP
jgi:hypothetical protein